MIEHAEKESLSKLVKDSATLSPENRELIMKQMDLITPEQAQKLSAILQKERQQVDHVEDEYKDRERQLKTNYLQTVEDFGHRGLREALNKWEKIEEEAGKEEVKNILKEAATENVDEKPGKHKPATQKKGLLLLVLLLAVMVAVGVIYYFYFYKP